MEEVMGIEPRLEMNGHAFRVGGAEPEAELGLAVRVDGFRELVVFELREVLMRERQPEAVAACLGERLLHPLRQMTEAMTLIHDTQERRPLSERERPETLRGLPRTMQQHRPDQSRRGLTKSLRQGARERT